jgi:PIN domain nuclease of toxin-antitoxin system
MTEARPLLLDTHAAIWVVEDQPLASKAVEAIDTAHRSDHDVFVSAIAAWEIGLLISRNRIGLSTRPELWFQGLLTMPGIKLVDLSPQILIASSFLPGKPPRDPADRIIIATARDLGATLITRDGLILRYAEEGQVSAIAC